MQDLATSLVSAKINSALGRLETLTTLTSEQVDDAIEQIIAEMAWEKTMSLLQSRSAGLFSQQIIDGGKIAANIPKRVVTNFAFDAVDDRAVLWAQTQAAALIREIDDETRNAIKKIVIDSLRGGYSGDDAAEMVSRIIGLNSRQTRAVENLYQSASKSLVEDGLSPKRAAARARQMAAEYRERLIDYRGKMIARTEIMRASNNGRLLSWAQALDDGLISSKMLKEWRTYPGFGARGPCPICLELRGSAVEIFTEFPNGSMMPPAHPFCRCTAILVPLTRGTSRTAEVGGGYLGAIDPIGAFLSAEIESSVEKFNPHHDPKTGRFTHGPGGAKVITLEATERNDALTGYADLDTRKSLAVITIERAEGTGGEAAEDWISTYTDPKGKGKTPDAVKNDLDVNGQSEKGWYIGSADEQAASARLMGLEVDPKLIAPAVMQRDTAIEFHAAIHKSDDSQPPLFRGIKQRLAADLNGEPQTPQVGDSMVLPLTSFSRSRGIAFGFNMEVVGDYMPKEVLHAPRVRHDSTIVRVRRGSRGYSIRYAEDSAFGLYESEVVSAGRFRVTGTSVIKVSHPYFETPREMHIVDVEQTDVFNPTTGQLEPVTIAKSRFRDFGGSLAHLFIGRQVPEDANGFAKANPYHDPRSGRFAFAPANDMGASPGRRVSEIFDSEIARLEREYGKLNNYGQVEREIPPDMSPKNVGSTKAALDHWTHLNPAWENAGYYHTGATMIRAHNMKHLGIVDNHKDAMGGKDHQEQYQRAWLSLETMTHVTRAEGHSLRMHEAVRRGKPAQPDLWRGTSSDTAMQQFRKSAVGDTFTMPLSSFTRDPRIANDYARDRDGPRIIIRVRAGARGVAVRNQYLHDQEVVTSGVFRIVSKETRDLTTFIDIEQVEVPNIDTANISSEGNLRDLVKAELLRREELKIALGLEAFSSLREGMGIEKANPYHDPKTGRFTTGPSGAAGAGEVASGGGTFEASDTVTNAYLKANGGPPPYSIGTLKSQTPIEIVDVDGTGGDAARDYLRTATNATAFYSDIDGSQVQMDSIGDSVFVSNRTINGDRHPLRNLDKPLDPSRPHLAQDCAVSMGGADGRPAPGFKNTSPKAGYEVFPMDEQVWVMDSYEYSRASSELMSSSGASTRNAILNNGDYETEYSASSSMLRSVHGSKPGQPTLWRGLDSPMVVDAGDGESLEPVVGDRFSQALTSFSHSSQVASSFANVGNTSGHTIIRLRKGSKGHAVRRSHGEMEVVSAGKYRIVGTAQIRTTRVDGSLVRTNIIDIEQTDTFFFENGEFVPIIMEKQKNKGRDVSIADQLWGNNHRVSALPKIYFQDTDFEKANPYHDRRTGRFTFAPANDMGGGGGAPVGERQAFATRMREAREGLGDAEIDYSLAPPEGIVGADMEADTLQKQIEFGHVVRKEIDRRTTARLESAEYRAQVEQANMEVARAKTDLNEVIAANDLMIADRDARRAVLKDADDKFRRACSESSDWRRVEARRDELSDKSVAARSRFTNERHRLGEEFELANPRNPEDNYYEYMTRRDAWVRTQPSYERALDEYEVLRMENSKWQRYMDEVNHNGRTLKEAYGDTGPGSRSRLKVSDDNPLKRDPFLMEALDARTKASRDFDAYQSDSWDKKYTAARAKVADAIRNRNSLKGETRRQVVREVLEDAGVEFGDGRVLVRSEILDGTNLDQAQVKDPSLRHWSETGSLITNSTKRSKAVRSVEQTAPYIPKRWVNAINNESINRNGRGVQIEFDRNRRGVFGDFEVRTDGENTSLHELLHAVEASSDRVPRFEAAFYRYRTRGETPVRLKDLHPNGRFRADEITRPDGFYNDYVGKIYGGGRYHELLTMSYADAMYPRGNDGLERMDPELQAWLWSTVILA